MTTDKGMHSDRLIVRKAKAIDGHIAPCQENINPSQMHWPAHTYEKVRQCENVKLAGEAVSQDKCFWERIF